MIYEKMRLDKYLLRNTLSTWPLVQQFIRTKRIRIEKDGRALEAISPGYKLQRSDILYYPKEIEKNLPEEMPPNIHLSKQFESMILKESSEYICVNKRGGVSVQGGKGIKNNLYVMANHYLCSIYIYPRIHIVHRLDQRVSGVGIYIYIYIGYDPRQNPPFC